MAIIKSAPLCFLCHGQKHKSRWLMTGKPQRVQQRWAIHLSWGILNGIDLAITPPPLSYFFLLLLLSGPPLLAQKNTACSEWEGRGGGCEKAQMLPPAAAVLFQWVSRFINAQFIINLSGFPAVVPTERSHFSFSPTPQPFSLRIAEPSSVFSLPQHK